MGGAKQIVLQANRQALPLDQGGRARRNPGGLLFEESELDDFIKDCSGYVPATEEDQSLFEDWIATEASVLATDGDLRYGALAGRIMINKLYNRTPATMREAVQAMYAHKNPQRHDKHTPLVTDKLYDIVMSTPEDVLESMIFDPHELADSMGFMGVSTVMFNYLVRSINQEWMENIGQMYLRVALGIHGDKLDDVREHCLLTSSGKLSNASPTMFYSGTPREQFMSCFLVTPDLKTQADGDDTVLGGDSIEGIFEVIKKMAIISAGAGGIGIDLSSIRCTGSTVGDSSTSDGIIPIMRVIQEQMKYVDQGKTKRPGACAVYLNIWHGDTCEFLQALLNGGNEDRRTRHLHIGLLICDLFMKRMREDPQQMWSFMCPYQVPKLVTTFGDEFEKIYLEAEAQGMFVKQIPCQVLWDQYVAKSHIETGEPYVLFVDHMNNYSNQKHLGKIRLSNLCVGERTRVLTRQGPREIGRYAAGSALQKANVEGYEKYVEDVKRLQAKAEQPDATFQDKTIAARATEIFKTREPVVELVNDESVEVWNGHAWSTVTPTCTGKDRPVMQVVTSYGSMITCTPEHQFIHQDGTPVAAKDLKIGTPLERTLPVEYDGCETIDHNITSQESYTMGFVYGYVLRQCGTELKDVRKRVQVLRVDKHMRDADNVLQILGYDEERARKDETFKTEDHDRWAMVYLAPRLQDMTAGLMMRIEDRKLWVRGFTDGLMHDLNNSYTDIYWLTDVIEMFKSVGEDMRLRLHPTNGLWKIDWVGARPGATEKEKNIDAPVVISLMSTGRVENVYCFTEPETGKGVFNGQLTHQCTEIMEYSDANEIACCTLCSVVLPMFVNEDTLEFDFDELHRVVERATVYTDRIIDVTKYQLKEMQTSNLKHRPIAIGVQGLADVFAMMQLPWEMTLENGRKVAHPTTRALQYRIYETIYHAFNMASIDLAKKYGPYMSFEGSPLSQGLFQFDLKPRTADLPLHYDWEEVRALIKKHGRRNSLGVGPMPTATTAKIRNRSEGNDPYKENCFTHAGHAGTYMCVNPHMIKLLQKHNLWNDTLRSQLEMNEGSLRGLLPTEFKWIENLFATAWEHSKQVHITLQAERSDFIDQGQSFWLYERDPSAEFLWKAMDLSHRLGNKNGLYYLRSKPSMEPLKFTQSKADDVVCRRDDPSCLSCSA